MLPFINEMMLLLQTNCRIREFLLAFNKVAKEFTLQLKSVRMLLKLENSECAKYHKLAKRSNF